MHPTLPLLAVLLAAASPAVGQVVPDSSCIVTRIVDGDTFYCRDGTRVRLLGVDSPERGQGPVARKATAALQRLLPSGRAVRLESDVSLRDRYGRRLAWVWSGDTLVNELMVAEGWAVRYTVPPDVRYVDRISRAEREAHDARRGMWVDGTIACRPVRWRRDRCAS